MLHDNINYCTVERIGNAAHLPWFVQRCTKQLQSRRTVDPSCLQLSNRVPYWLHRIPQELWKSIRVWLCCYCSPLLRVCHLTSAPLSACTRVALAHIRECHFPPANKSVRLLVERWICLGRLYARLIPSGAADTPRSLLACFERKRMSSSRPATWHILWARFVCLVSSRYCLVACFTGQRLRAGK